MGARSKSKSTRLIEALADRKAASAIMNGGKAKPGAIYPLPWAVVAAFFAERTGEKLTEQEARMVGARAVERARRAASRQVVVYL